MPANIEEQNTMEINMVTKFNHLNLFKSLEKTSPQLKKK